MYIIPYTDIETKKSFDKLEKGSEYTGYNYIYRYARYIYIQLPAQTRKGEWLT